MFAFTGESGYTLGFRRKIAHKGTHGETGVVSDGAAITTLDTSRTFTNIPGPGIRTANFAAFGPWLGALPKASRPRCVIFIRMLIALLGGSVANFPVLWYDKFNKLESVMH